MGRKWIRNGISQKEVEFFLERKQVNVINPTWKDVVDAVKKVQSRCRKNIFDNKDMNDLKRAFESLKFFDVNMPSVYKEYNCPSHFEHGVSGTVAQFVKINDKVIAFGVARVLVPPGQRSKPLVFRGDFMSRYNQIVSNFWTHLKDEEIAHLRREAVSRALLFYYEQQNLKNEESDGIKRSVKLLCNGVLPTFVSELIFFTRTILDKMLGTKDRIKWSDIKKRYPSETTLYKKELLQIVSDGNIYYKDLRELALNSEFTLSLDVWWGMQRIIDVPQIVFKIQADEIMNHFSKKGGSYRSIILELKKLASGDILHPCDKHTVGWFRVHIDYKRAIVFIDEVQSDLLEHLESFFKDNKEAQEIRDSLRRWIHHGFVSIRAWATEMSYRVAIHSKESALKKVGMTQSERKWNLYYRPIIKKYGFEEIQVSEYGGNIHIEQID